MISFRPADALTMLVAATPHAGVGYILTMHGGMDSPGVIWGAFLSGVCACVAVLAAVPLAYRLIRRHRLQFWIYFGPMAVLFTLEYILWYLRPHHGWPAWVGVLAALLGFVASLGIFSRPR